MISELKGKKILVLGGNAISCDIVNAAKSMGIYTVVTDWNELRNAPAKQIADEYWNISLLDYEALVSAIQEHGIDGIITGFTDSYLLPYQRLCELTGLPCYATKDVLEITLDKGLFKQYCIEHGVPVIPKYNITNFDEQSISEKNKIVIKPVDNSGSRGVIVCKSSESFKRSLDFSLSFSEKKEVIIEKYMDMDSFAASYTIQDGVLSLSTLNDRLEHKSSETAAITTAGIYPSKYLDLYLEKMNMPVKKMFQSLGVKNGVLSIQGFVDGKQFYVMEMGYRLTGGQHYIFSKFENNISALDCLIHYAITGKMANFCIAQIDNPRFKDICLNLCILGKSGRINSYEGREFVEGMKEVVHAAFLKEPGDEIGMDGTTAQKIANLHLVLKSRTDIERVVADIQKHFHAYDTDGRDLVLELMK